MSLAFNDTTTKKGLVQFYEHEIGDENGGSVSGNTKRLKQFTADCNLAWDDFMYLAFPASGTWQFDDSNHTDYPVIKTNIVSAQRDYTFTTDEGGNLILDVYKTFILQSATATLYEEIYPIDELNESYNDIVAEGTTGATPYRYGKMANGIFLDPIPGYSATNGLKVYINREASYFVSTDTTKKPGVPGLLQAWFYLKPALEYARRNNLANERKLKETVLEFEQKIKNHFAWRARDERKILTTSRIQFR